MKSVDKLRKFVAVLFFGNFLLHTATRKNIAAININYIFAMLLEGTRTHDLHDLPRQRNKVTTKQSPRAIGNNFLPRHHKNVNFTAHLLSHFLNVNASVSVILTLLSKTLFNDCHRATTANILKPRSLKKTKANKGFLFASRHEYCLLSFIILIMI